MKRKFKTENSKPYAKQSKIDMTTCEPIYLVDDIMKNIFQFVLASQVYIDKAWGTIRIVCKRWKDLARLSNMISQDVDLKKLFFLAVRHDDIPCVDVLIENYGFDPLVDNSSAIYESIRYNSSRVFHRFLTMGISDGRSFEEFAIQSGSKDVLMKIVQTKSPSFILKNESCINKLLHYHYGALKAIIDYCLNQHTDPSLYEDFLKVISDRHFQENVCIRGYTNLFKMIVERVTDIDYDGMLTRTISAGICNMEMLRYLLNSQMWSVKRIIKKIELCASNGWANELRELLIYVKEVPMSEELLNDLLKKTIRSKNPNAVRVLIQQRPEIVITKHALIYALQGPDELVWILLRSIKKNVEHLHAFVIHLAAERYQTNLVKNLLTDENINHDGVDFTIILKHACYLNDEEFVKELLNNHRIVLTKECIKKTYNNHQILKTLLEYDPNNIECMNMLMEFVIRQSLSDENISALSYFLNHWTVNENDLFEAIISVFGPNSPYYPHPKEDYIGIFAIVLRIWETNNLAVPFYWRFFCLMFYMKPDVGPSCDQKPLSSHLSRCKLIHNDEFTCSCSTITFIVEDRECTLQDVISHVLTDLAVYNLRVSSFMSKNIFNILKRSVENLLIQ